MEVSFSSAKLQKLCNSESKLRGRYGPRMAGLIQQRLMELADADCLEDVRHLPGHYHELHGNLDGKLAVNLVHPDRLVFRPVGDSDPKKADGGLNWLGVTAVEIVGIGDYHE